MSDMSDQRPRTLSVVIPAFNEADAIGTCLRALLAQSPPPTEIIVVDNNSSDDTARAAAAFSGPQSVVRVVTETRQGVQHARDRGVAEATGDLIARIDADTYASAGWVAAIHRFFAVAPDHIGGGYGMMTMHDLPFQKPFAAMQRRLTARVRSKLDAGSVTVVGEAIGGNCVMRAQVWREVAGTTSRRGDIMEDADLSLTIRGAGWKFGLIPDMTAQTSGRRLASSPRNYWRYTAYSPRTYAMHGRRRAAVFAAIGIQFARAAHLLIWAVLLWWDLDEKRFRGRPAGLRKGDRELPSGLRTD